VFGASRLELRDVIEGGQAVPAADPMRRLMEG
jgi:hypothetical protein